MTKKLVAFAIVAIITLGAFGLMAFHSNSLVKYHSNNLGKYKTEGKAAIDTYVATKNQDDYTVEKWTELLTTAQMGKQAIDKAESKLDIDNTFTTTKEKIDKVDTRHFKEYKETAKAAIDTHVATKNQDDYSAEKWTELLSTAQMGKQAIDKAESKSDIDNIVTTTKEEIDKIDDLGGKFYTLDYAFENGWLTVEQLQSIAYYYYEDGIAHDHSECEPFTPIPKNPLTLDSDTQTAIKEEYFKELITRDYIETEYATLDNVIISDYHGTYGKCIIVGVIDDCACYDYIFHPERIIGGVSFRKFCGSFAQVWRIK